MSEERCTIVAVCGSPGSGKTTFTLALGEALAARHKKTVCLSPDPVCPALPYWLPALVPTPGMANSLGALLQYTFLDLESVAHCLIPHPDFPDLALMGNEYGCYPGKYDMSGREAVNTVLDLLRREVDYLIVDCCTDIRSDRMSHTAFTSADLAVCLLTPNCKGLSWLACAEGQNLQMDGTLKVLNPVLRQTPMDALRARIPDLGFSLPYSEELELRMCAGSAIRGFQKQAGSYYESAVSSLAAKLIARTAKEEEP